MSEPGQINEDNSKNTSEKRTNRTWYGPLLVSLGAFLWSTDAIFRSEVVSSFSALFIVTATHTICLFVTLPLFAWNFKHLKSFRRKEWFAIGFLAIGGSILAMVCFTKAFASTSNYNIPILLQKLQPIIAISLAAVILKEKISRSFIILAIIAIFGAYLVSFGDLSAVEMAGEAHVSTIVYTLLAAAIWGTCTVASRFLLDSVSFTLVTSARYFFATVILLIACAIQGDLGQVADLTGEHIRYFATMALIPGLLALFIYYWGMQGTSASRGTLCELSFPLGSILINWVMLDSPLNTQQILGAVMLVSAVTFINLQKGKS